MQGVPPSNTLWPSVPKGLGRRVFAPVFEEQQAAVSDSVEESVAKSESTGISSIGSQVS